MMLCQSNSSTKWRQNSTWTENAVILILAGIHGRQDGKLGNPDLGLLEDYQGQIDYFMGKSKKQPPEKIGRDISNLNIQVSIVWTVNKVVFSAYVMP